jgi:hypothetical protein
MNRDGCILNRTSVAAGAIAFVLCAAQGALASPPAAGSPPAAPASQPQQPPPSSLDDLLDLDKDKPQQPGTDDGASQGQRPPGASGDAAVDEAKRELDKQLTEAEVADAFEQAVEKMGLAAEMLDVKFDSSLTTQRVQEDIIAKLNQLLDQAKKSKSQASSSSSSSAQQRQQQQQKQNPGQKQQQNQNQNANRNPNPADNRSELDPPDMQQGDINTVIEETRSEWGNLPPRLREQLMQGRKDKFSSLYDRLTYEYYKRLAEENSP